MIQVGVQFYKNKINRCLKFKNYLLNTNKPTQKPHTKHQFYSKNFKKRSQWRNSNHMALYYDYFAVFSFDTFHTFSYIADYLEVIHENAIYENNYFDFYGIKI
jgi:hypothetical protein